MKPKHSSIRKNAAKQTDTSEHFDLIPKDNCMMVGVPDEETGEQVREALEFLGFCVKAPEVRLWDGLGYLIYLTDADIVGPNEMADARLLRSMAEDSLLNVTPRASNPDAEFLDSLMRIPDADRIVRFATEWMPILRGVINVRPRLHHYKLAHVRIPEMAWKRFRRLLKTQPEKFAETVELLMSLFVSLYAEREASPPEECARTEIRYHGAIEIVLFVLPPPVAMAEAWFAAVVYNPQITPRNAKNFAFRYFTLESGYCPLERRPVAWMSERSYEFNEFSVYTKTRRLWPGPEPTLEGFYDAVTKALDKSLEEETPVPPVGPDRKQQRRGSEGGTKSSQATDAALLRLLDAANKDNDAVYMDLIADPTKALFIGALLFDIGFCGEMPSFQIRLGEPVVVKVTMDQLTAGAGNREEALDRSRRARHAVENSRQAVASARMKEETEEALAMLSTLSHIDLSLLRKELLRRPRAPHYFFAYTLFPNLFVYRPTETRAIVEGGDHAFNSMWHKAWSKRGGEGEAPPGPRIQTVQIGVYSAIVGVMPPPEAVAEAAFVAIVEAPPTSRPGIRTPALFRYFTLERGYCPLTHRRVNWFTERFYTSTGDDPQIRRSRSGVESTLEAFLAAIAQCLGQTGRA